MSAARTRFRRWHAAAVALLVLAAAATVAAAQAPAAAPARPATGRITIEVSGVESARGQLLALLFRSADGFPDRPKRALMKQARKARAGTQLLVFDGVPAGAFALAVLHDEDGDFTLDTGLFGAPTEGYGFSRNASDPFSAPEFEECRLMLRAGQHLLVRIRMRN